MFAMGLTQQGDKLCLGLRHRSNDTSGQSSAQKTGQSKTTGKKATQSSSASSFFNGLKNLGIRLSYPGRRLVVDMLVSPVATALTIQRVTICKTSVLGMKLASNLGLSGNAQKHMGRIGALLGYVASIPASAIGTLAFTPLKTLADIPVSLAKVVFTPTNRLSTGLKETGQQLKKNYQEYNDLHHLFGAADPAHYLRHRKEALALVTRGSGLNSLPLNEYTILNNFMDDNLYKHGANFLSRVRINVVK